MYNGTTLWNFLNIWKIINARLREIRLKSLITFCRLISRKYKRTNDLEWNHLIYFPSFFFFFFCFFSFFLFSFFFLLTGLIGSDLRSTEFYIFFYYFFFFFNLFRDPFKSLYSLFYNIVFLVSLRLFIFFSSMSLSFQSVGSLCCFELVTYA